MALSLGTVVVGKKTDLGLCRIVTARFESRAAQLSTVFLN
jgi:hypothetical protein